VSTDRTDGEFIAGFMDDYFAECDEHLTEVRRILLAADPAAGAGLDREALEDLFRSFHSLKGLSGMVELREAELLAHEMEDYLRLLRDGEMQFSAAGHDALVKGTRALEQVIASRREQKDAVPVHETLALLSSIAAKDLAARTAIDALETDTPAPPRRWRALFTPSPDLAARGVNVDHVRRRLRESARLVEAAPRIAADGTISFEFILEDLADDVVPESWTADGITAAVVETPAIAPLDSLARADTVETGGTGSAPGAILNPSHYVRVDLAKLDELMRMIGDMVISRARLGESLTQVEPHVPAVQWRTVQENGLALERQLRDLREGVMRLRLVPVGEIFRRMSFVVRDLARESGKKMDLRLRGQDTEIDKFLVERMMDPVLHLVRNAVSHGIEPPHARIAHGKTDVGHLALSASSVGDIVTIEIADDGAGVDAGAVAARARALGMTVADGLLDGPALLEILCAPGFSTRDAADRAAGRGVGMGVVQSTIRELGGTLSIDTEPGQGTRFIIELPVSLAIADAIIATVGTQTFAVPQSAIREVIEVEPTSLRAIENHEIAPYRGAVLPIIRLSRLFKVASVPRRALHVFVVGHGLSAVGIAVDRIVGQREVVVRPMVDPLIRVEGVTGATDLGDGRVVLILDAMRIARAGAAAPVGALES
jgi:two-component system, chemotaxis family, sensor kinase CheA